MSKARGPVLMPELNPQDLHALVGTAQAWIRTSVPAPQAATLVAHIEGAKSLLKVADGKDPGTISGRSLLDYLEQIEKYNDLMSDFVKVQIAAVAFQKEGSGDV